ncbi:DUF6922 domain-containing protein [Luteirhabdus pelagi]|uniref:DUF6922 domain-containing protein n=1 Tax=Luteirhabdus pelagi TaxID=2792783 RepID=UPI0019392BA6|nr:helix-turn-helix domain-containing protein [Luteirhabdus pelagi]
MLPKFEKAKGSSPGTILRKGLEEKSLTIICLAKSINEHRQVISAILNDRRHINLRLSIKLGRVFDVDADYFMLLQSSYDVGVALNNEPKKRPRLYKFRSTLFGERDLYRLDWQKNKTFIVERVLEQGNQKEILELISFYGKTCLQREVKNIRIRHPLTERNIQKYGLKG